VAEILVIESDPGQRSMMAEALKFAGHNVSSAGSGLEGVDEFTKIQPQSVVLDMLIPDKSGINVIQALVQKGCRTDSIIAISDKGEWLSSDFILEMAREFGVKQTLSKPFVRKDLLDCVNAVLEN
jgi:DNA-binding response OmpR family regulator